MAIILAKIFGLYYLAVGIAFFLNQDRLKRLYQQILKDESLLYISGVLAVLIGAFVISVHNVWVLGWPVVITLIGWGSLIKGYGLMIYSDFASFFTSMMSNSKSYLVIGVISTLLGLFLLYHGWSAKL